jgi:DNA polymerase III epsilon subunit-like protein
MKERRIHTHPSNPACSKIDGCELPSTETCLKRAGLDPTVKHRALEDARVVCRLIRFIDKVVPVEQVA